MAACYASGVTSGTSATTYGSNDPVTAVQASLMLMKALGYFQYQSDFGGDWQIATIKQASSIDLFNGINTGANDALSRDNVAQLALNALEATMVEPDGTLTGHNTDGLGFVANLRVHGVDVKGAKMVVLGAGGAATAVTMQSAVDGASEIHIFNRKGYTFYPNAELTVKKITERIPGCKATVTDLFDTEALAEAVKNCDILVNATKVGMAPLDKETLIDKSLFRPDLIVCDTVYNPKETRMIVEAKEAGVRAAIGGIGMLLRQGVEGFRLYTGQEMPADEVMDKFFA